MQRLGISVLFLVFLWVQSIVSAMAAQPQQKPGHKAEAKDMRLLAHNDLQARSAYQPVIHQQGGRFLAYIGHHRGKALNPMTGMEEPNGTSIVDVTDPRKPKYVAHIPGATQGAGEAGGAQMVRVCDGKGLSKADPTKTYLLRTRGNEAHEVWDVTAPAQPKLVSTVVSGLTTTHKNWWECDTGIAYLVSYKKDEG